MRVGIITYHFAKNYGAVLQCYALQNYLQSKGYDVTVFDFVSKVQLENNDIIKHGKNVKQKIKNLCLLPFKSKIKEKSLKFENFCEHKLNLSPRFNEVSELEKYVNENNFDIIISGSDQVLNPNILDFNEAFLYPFKTKAKKVFYAASTGSASKEDIEKIERFIEEFDHIAIREKNDFNKFSDGLHDRLNVVCDPVTLLTSNEWKKMTTNSVKTPYLVCYFLHKNLFKEEFKIAKKIAKKLNLKLIIINARFSKYSFLKGTLFNVGPVEFVDLFANASYVCTDSFHGTLFSLIFNKQFTSFDTNLNKKDTRRKGLLEEVGALDAFSYIEDEFVLDYKLNYDSINHKIQQIRENAINYLGSINE